MENTMAKYMGKNFKDVISDIQVVQGTSKNSGSTYYAVELTFINGYKKRMFLTNDERFAWTDAFSLLETQVQVDTNF